VNFARLQVFTAVKIHVKHFWVVTPCSVVVGYQCFRDQGEDGDSMDL